MEFVNEELTIELQVLESVYSSAELNIAIADENVAVVFKANPRMADGGNQSFVCLTLQLLATRRFPSEPPKIRIGSSRGLGIKREEEALKLLEADWKENQSLFGLCELTRDILDGMNSPEGSCAICLQRMNVKTEELIVCPCYHSYHVGCFREWWKKQQDDLAVKEKEIIAKNGGRLFRLKLPKKSKGVYVLQCPICRFEIIFDDVESCLRSNVASIWHAEQSQTVDEVLTAEEIALVRTQQEKWTSMYQRQEQNGSFFSATPFVLTIESPPRRNL